MIEMRGAGAGRKGEATPNVGARLLFMKSALVTYTISLSCLSSGYGTVVVTLYLGQDGFWQHF